MLNAIKSFFNSPETKRNAIVDPARRITALDGKKPATALQNAFDSALARTGVHSLSLLREQSTPDRLWLGEDVFRTPDGLSFVLSDGTRDEAEYVGSGVSFISEPPTGDGAAWSDGMVYNRDKTQRFLPAEGRGLIADHGSFYQTYLECGPLRRSHAKLVAPLHTGVWRVRPPDITTDDIPRGMTLDQARAMYMRQARFAERRLMRGLEGGFSKFIHEASLGLIQGFSPFVELYAPPTPGNPVLLRRLQYIWPSNIDRYFVDSDESIVAVSMYGAGGTEKKIVDASHMSIFSWDEVGLDPEGNGYARSVVVWWEILQMASRLEAIVNEKFGSPYVWVSRKSGENASKKEDVEKLTEVIAAAIAAENPIIQLPDGVTISVSGATGGIPSFDGMKRFALERINEILVGESSLIAVGQAGSFAARESASSDATGFAPRIAKWISDNLNGADNRRTTGIIPKMVDNAFAGVPVPGLYPEIEFSLTGFDDSIGTEKIIAAATAGLVDANHEVRVYMHERLKLPPPTPQDAAPTSARVEPPVAGTSLALPAPATSIQAAFRLSDIDPIAVSKTLDRFDAKMSDLMTSAVAAWTKRVTDALDVQRRTNEINVEFLFATFERLRPTLQSAILAAAQGSAVATMRYGAQTLGDQLGHAVNADGVELLVDSAALTLRIQLVANEIVQRSEGLIAEKFVQFARGEANIGIPKLAESTIAAAASKVTSTALNLGREAMMTEVIERAATLGISTNVIAERSAVMDQNTCAQCAALDGARVKFGSRAYFNISPPNKCAGGDRCRCIFTFILPDEDGYAEALARLL